jgi:hypothetical protein
MKIYKVTLQQHERDELEEMARKGSRAAWKIINALILLGCDEGPHHPRRLLGEDLAAALNVSARKIDRVKKRFVEEGFEAVFERRPSPRNYARKADGDFEAHLVALSCTSPPEGHARWSLRLLADRAVELEYVESVSYETVRRVLKKTNSSRGKKPAG